MSSHIRWALLMAQMTGFVLLLMGLGRHWSQLDTAAAVLIMVPEGMKWLIELGLKEQP